MTLGKYYKQNRPEKDLKMAYMFFCKGVRATDNEASRQAAEEEARQVLGL